MIAQQPITAFTGWDNGPAKKTLSPRDLMVGGAILAVHLAGAVYLYNTKIAPTFVTEPPDKVTLIDTVRIKQDPPPQDRPEPQKPKFIKVHPPIDATPTTVKPIDLTPQVIDPPVDDRPPVAVKDVVKEAPPAATSTPPQPPKVIANPTWITRPSAEQLSQFYPPRALDDGLSGEATLDCVVTAAGKLTGCAISGETPKNRGFAQAALKASGIFRMSPRTVDGQPVEGGTVHIPIHFAVKE